MRLFLALIRLQAKSLMPSTKFGLFLHSHYLTGAGCWWACRVGFRILNLVGGYRPTPFFTPHDRSATYTPSDGIASSKSLGMF